MRVAEYQESADPSQLLGLEVIRDVADFVRAAGMRTVTVMPTTTTTMARRRSFPDRTVAAIAIMTAATAATNRAAILFARLRSLGRLTPLLLAVQEVSRLAAF